MRGLFLLHAFRRTTYGSEGSNPPSRFLADIPRDLLETSFSRAAGGGRAGRMGGMLGRRVGATSAGRDTDRESVSSGDRGRGGSAGTVLGLPRRPLPWSAARSEGPLGGASTRDDESNGRSATRPATGPVAGRKTSFARGERVRHPEYGEGTVLVSSFAGSDELVLVRFDVRPDKPKNLSLAIHRLERV